MLSGIWTELEPAGSLPPVRIQHDAAYNDSNNRMIVFGGSNGAGVSAVPPLLNDVWVLSNADATTGTPTWTQLSLADPSPSKRSEIAHIYDESSNRLVLFGGNPSVGSCFGTTNDLWLLENADGTGGPAAWTQQAPTGSIPSPRGNHTLNYDSLTNRMILLGGNQACGPALSDLWVLEHANGLDSGSPATPNWIELSQTGDTPLGGLSGHTSVYDETNNRLVAYNGNVVRVLEHANGLDMGLPATPNWTLLSPAADPVHGTPAILFGHSAVYDPDTNEMTVFGGFSSGARLDDVWVLSNANGLGGAPAWTKIISDGSSPMSRDFHSAVYDNDSNQMIIFAGRNETGGSFAALNDVWLLNVSNTLNTPPVASDDAYEVNEDGTLVVDAAGGVLANDSDADGDTLTVTEVNGEADDVDQMITLPSGAKLTLNANGSFTYTPLADFSEIDTFTYRVSDGKGGFANANVTINVLSTQQQIDNAISNVDALVAAGILNNGQGNSLISKLDNAANKFDQGKTNPGINQLEALINQLEAFINSSILDDDEGEDLINQILSAIASAG